LFLDKFIFVIYDTDQIFTGFRINEYQQYFLRVFIEEFKL